MGAWLKIFDDGTEELGSDRLISEGKASWSKGRLNNIEAVKLFGKTNTALLFMSPLTEWHQFDRFQVSLSLGFNTQPTITHRVVQAKIKQEHVGLSIVNKKDISAWAVIEDPDGTLITDEDIGKWITVILSDQYCPRMILSTKGKINDDKQLLK